MSSPARDSMVGGELLFRPGQHLAIATEAAQFIASRGGRLTPTEVRAGLGGTSDRNRAAAGAGTGIAVVPILGPMARGFDFWGMGTNTMAARTHLLDLAADKTVSGILLLVDSLGGEVVATPELAATVRDVRNSKPVVAAISGVAASAAYWVASQADQVILTPSGFVGSIGVFTLHIDETGALERMGLKVTLISSSPEKVETAPFVTLSDQARAAQQLEIDAIYKQFVADVARGRGVPTTWVLSRMGSGRMLGAERALAAGAVDTVAPLEYAFSALRSAIGRFPQRQAAKAALRALSPHRLAVGDRRPPTAFIDENCQRALARLRAL